jgi:hypothetical protein
VITRGIGHSVAIRFWAYGLILSPVTLGKLEFGSKIDEAEAGKVVRRSTAGSTFSTRPMCTQAAEARRSWGGHVRSAIM